MNANSNTNLGANDPNHIYEWKQQYKSPDFQCKRQYKSWSLGFRYLTQMQRAIQILELTIKIPFMNANNNTNLKANDQNPRH